MTIKRAVMHVFANGTGILDVGHEATPHDLEALKEAWGSQHRKGGVLVVGTIEFEVIEHQNPLDFVEVSSVDA